MKDALDVHRSLLGREIPHEVVRLPRPVAHADEIAEVLGLPADRVVVVRLYLADDRPVALLVRAGTVPHPGAVLGALQASSLRSVRAEFVNELTDFAAPLVSPVLLPAGLPVLADACVGHAEIVYTATGDPGTVLGISSRHLLTAAGARVTELCLPEPPAWPADVPAELAALPHARHWR